MKLRGNVPVFAFMKFSVIGPINDNAICFDNKNHHKRKKWGSRVLTHQQIKAEEKQLFRFHTCLTWISCFFLALQPGYPVHTCSLFFTSLSQYLSPASPSTSTSTSPEGTVEDQLSPFPSSVTSNTVVFPTAVQWFAKWYFKSDYSKIAKLCKLLQRIEFLECLPGNDATGCSYHFFSSLGASKYDAWLEICIFSLPSPF